jgi:ATP-dependent Clp protease adaptor protein ClpS
VVIVTVKGFAANMTQHTLDPVKQAQRVEPPPMYSVVLHNDDYTTFDFVVSVLTEICGLTQDAAFAVTKEVHTMGKGYAGLYTRDVAETKQILMMDAAKQEQYPLLVTIEPRS